jgi:hypothetical protein
MIAQLGLALVLCGAAQAGPPQEPANSFDPQIQKEFDQRVNDYVKLRKTAQEGLDKLKPTKSAEQIEHHEKGLAHKIRELRADARPGDIFTSDVSEQFRRLVGTAMHGADSTRIRQSLHRAEPVHLKNLRVNGSYPKGVPLQSMPPTLLSNLPKLPSGLEYRVVGSSLILLDGEAGLVVDFIPDILPVVSDAH